MKYLTKSGDHDKVRKAAPLYISTVDIHWDREKGVKATEIAKDGIAVIVNNDNDLEELSSDQVKSIFTGDITDWEDVTK